LPKIKVNDINIYYEVYGEGFPCVMIMGTALCLKVWDDPLIDELSRRYETILFDNRGSGKTDIPDGKYTIKLMADDTAGLMNALNIDRAHIIGVSMGGMIAQELVLNYPEKVEKLVLWGANCGGRKTIPPKLAAYKFYLGAIEGLTPERMAKATIPLLLTPEFIKNNPDYVEDKIQRILSGTIPFSSYARQLKAMIGLNTYRRLKTIKTPTLILQGKKDIVVPPENGEILANQIPGAKLVKFEKSGHAIYPHEP
jgi:pimeloyl-ACP methyl ester carboxylesterase